MEWFRDAWPWLNTMSTPAERMHVPAQAMERRRCPNGPQHGYATEKERMPSG